METILSRKAAADYDAILDYTIENFGPDQAEKYGKGLDYSFKLLAENPYMGVQYNDKFRRFVYREHVVYYRITPNYILIAEIRHGKQSPPDIA